MKKFTKEYVRDFSLILEEPWAQGLVSSSKLYLDTSEPPLPFVVFYATAENLEIWEHREALDWYMDQLLEKNKQGTEFIEWALEEYAKRLKPIEERWHAGPTADKEALRAYLEENRVALEVFSLWYYTAADERTPEGVRQMALALRNTDDYFASNNIFIKGCLDLLGGRRDLGNVIFTSEFPEMPDEAVLQTRAHGVVSVDGVENYSMTLTEFQAKNPEYEFIGLGEAVDPTLSEVKGQIAYKGHVKGIVKILKNERDMRTVQEGDILVSPMTTPDFLPAMKLAAAFVTDEGGITCHAGIVAREMKKPCVIGTKLATQVFKDGDLVEVDADNGVVRIIERK